MWRRKRRRAGLIQKSFYWVSSISISFGPSLSEVGGVEGANYTGLHSISISLCCHGSWALSCMKISHCSSRGLPCLNTHVIRYTHACHWRGRWLVHLVWILSHIFTLLLQQPLVWWYGSAAVGPCAFGLEWTCESCLWESDFYRCQLDKTVVLFLPKWSPKTSNSIKNWSVRNSGRFFITL